MKMHCRLLWIFPAVLFWSGIAVAQVEELPKTPEQEKRDDMRLPELDRSALEPSKRLPVDVGERERNPFGLLAAPPKQEEKAVQVEAETEEMKIRRILGNMRVTGRNGSSGAYQVQLGTILVKEGDTLPRLFANQAEDLRVQTITDRQIVLTFLERRRAEDLPPRSIGLSYDLTPRVRSLMHGEVFEEAIKFENGAPAMTPLSVFEIDRLLKQAKEENLSEALTEQRRAFLGEGARRVGEETASDESE